MITIDVGPRQGNVEFVVTKYVMDISALKTQIVHQGRVAWAMASSQALFSVVANVCRNSRTAKRSRG